MANLHAQLVNQKNKITNSGDSNCQDPYQSVGLDLKEVYAFRRSLEETAAVRKYIQDVQHGPAAKTMEKKYAKEKERKRVQDVKDDKPAKSAKPVKPVKM